MGIGAILEAYAPTIGCWFDGTSGKEVEAGVWPAVGKTFGLLAEE
jgi:hypothetical protein